MADDAPKGERRTSKWIAGLALERSRARQAAYRNRVIGSETRAQRELRLSQLYGTNTPDPFIARRTLRSPPTDADPLELGTSGSPAAAAAPGDDRGGSDHGPDGTAPAKPARRRRAQRRTKPSIITGRPGWRPAGPRVPALEATPSVDDRPVDPYLEPWHGNPHKWDNDTEFVTGSYADGGYCVEELPSHHGLSSFDKLHRDTAKRKFRRGMTKLTAMLRMTSALKAMVPLSPASAARTAEVKRANVNNMVAMLKAKGFNADGSKAPPEPEPSPARSPKHGRMWGPGRPKTSPVAPQSHIAARRKRVADRDQDQLLLSSGAVPSATTSTLRSVASPSLLSPVSVGSHGSRSSAGAGAGASPVRSAGRSVVFGGGGAPRPVPHTIRNIHRHFTVLKTEGRTKDTSLVDPESKIKERQELRQRMKWRELHILHEWMTKGPDRVAGMADLEQLRNELRRAAAENGEPNVVNRDQFWAILSVRHLPLANSNRLFSSFDVTHENKVDIREVLASLRALRRPKEDLTDKLVGMLSLYSGFSEPQPMSRADALTCIALLCKTDADRLAVEHAVTDAFVETLGVKSVWAKDITPKSMADVVYYASTLPAELRRVIQSVLHDA